MSFSCYLRFLLIINTYMAELDLTGYTQINQRFFYNRFLRLGGGSFGNVYKGYDNERKKFIAVKQIPRINLHGVPPGELKEITIMKQLKHPNIMEFYGSSGDRTSPDGIFMFIELCEGGTLGNLIASKLTERRAYELFKQLVEAMVYMNDQRLFHRDLKPDNLLITSNGDLKIADFGIAREIQEGTATFKRCTPVYSAPEVYIQEIYERNEGDYNEKCDVFSAGYILYEMLTSEALNKGVKTAADLHKFLMNNKKKGGFEINHQALTARWIQLLTKMLAFQPAKRLDFKTIRQKLKQFQAPVDKLPQVRQRSVIEQQQSSDLVKKVRKLVELICSRNNYLISFLKVVHRFQQERSKVVPRVYKNVLLYLTLSRYCYLSQDGLKQLDDKQAFILPDSGMNMTDIEQWLTLQDKVIMTNFLKAVSTRINQGKEQIKLFLLSEILPKLQEILNTPPNTPQRKVVEQYNITQGIQLLKQNEYQADQSYKFSINRCVNNLYRTAAEIEVLTDQDLRIYLVSLYVAHIDSYVSIMNYESCILPPSFETVLQMDRKELQKRISEQKNKD